MVGKYCMSCGCFNNLEANSCKKCTESFPVYFDSNYSGLGRCPPPTKPRHLQQSKAEEKEALGVDEDDGASLDSFPELDSLEFEEMATDEVQKVKFSDLIKEAQQSKIEK